VSVASQARVGGARLRRHWEVVGWVGPCAGQHLDEAFSLRQKVPRSISRPGRGTSDNDAADSALVAGLRRWESSERALEGDECPDRSESGPRAVSSGAGAGRSEGKRCEGGQARCLGAPLKRSLPVLSPRELSARRSMSAASAPSPAMRAEPLDVRSRTFGSSERPSRWSRRNPWRSRCPTSIVSSAPPPPPTPSVPVLLSHRAAPFPQFSAATLRAQPEPPLAGERQRALKGRGSTAQ